MPKKIRKLSEQTQAADLAPTNINQSTSIRASRFSRNKTGRFGSLKKHWLAVGLITLLSLSVVVAGLEYLKGGAKGTAVMTAQTLPPPQLTKEYIYAGSRMLAVEDAGANSIQSADLTVWRPSTGEWWVMGVNGAPPTVTQWGTQGDVPVPGDYDGDGKSDFSVFRPSNNRWYVIRSSNNSYYEIPFGTAGDKTVPADFDGDGKTDIAVYRPSNGTWYIQRSSDSNVVIQQFGVAEDKPAAADYDGDGRVDIGVLRGSDLTFYVLRSGDNQVQSVTLGRSAADVPVSGDYDGDGRADFAIKNRSTWMILSSSTNQTQYINWQLQTDRPVPGDYDADGMTDVAVWREATGDWLIRNSSDGQLRQVQWGQSGDIPIPAFRRR